MEQTIEYSSTNSKWQRWVVGLMVPLLPLALEGAAAEVELESSLVGSETSRLNVDHP
jgi:hypothetical protein